MSFDPFPPYEPSQPATSGSASYSQAPAPSFGLGGRRWQLRKQVPYQLVRNAVLGFTTGQTGDIIRSAESMLTYAVDHEQRAEFRRFLAEVPEDDVSVFTFEDLISVVREVAATVTGVPFQPPSGSSASSTPTNSASISEASSPSVASTSPARNLRPSSV